MSKNQFPLDENRREYEAWFNYYANKYDQERQSHLTPSVARAKAGQVFNLAGLNGPENAQDTIIGHLTPGEIVIPLNYQTAELKRYLTNLMGHDLLKYTVGSGEEKLNPESGLPAFGLHELHLN